MKRKRLYYTLFIVAVVLFLFTATSAYFLRYALYNGDRHYDEDAQWNTLTEQYPQLREWSDSIRRGPLKHDWMVNADGDSIRLYIVPARRPTARTVVLAHGYTDCAVKMMHIGYMYHHDLGYNVVAYDQYAHGASQGSMIQMGWKDRKNLIACARQTEHLFGDSIVLHGISMGGATVMMASGDEELPGSVRAIVDDCGYTSVWDEYQGELKNQFGLPSFPLLHITSMASKIALGWSFSEASALESVRRTHVPMLFIHGDADTYVPTAMVHPLYEAHPGRKALWLSPGSSHAQSYHDHPSEYTMQVRKFLCQ